MNKDSQLIIYLLVIATAIASLLYFSFRVIPYFVEGGSGIVKLRNSLLIELGHPEDLIWLPNNEPKGYRVENNFNNLYFDKIISNLDIEGQTDWNKALLIANHILRYPKRTGKSIKSNSISSYTKIREQGAGYCADYTQVFTAFAHSARLSVREWGFSDEEFGGGHAFGEVYSKELKKWVFIDVFNSFYFVDTIGNPLSVSEIADSLLSKKTVLEAREINPNRFGFKDHLQAVSYYKKGFEQHYMWWGNDINTYEADKIISIFSFSRYLEQAAAIILAKHAKMKVIPNDNNKMHLASAKRNKNSLVGMFWSSIILIVFIPAALIRKKKLVMNT